MKKITRAGAAVFFSLLFPVLVSAHTLPSSEDILAITEIHPDSGKTGDRITISGHGFARTGNTVLFSSRDALQSLISDGAISNLYSKDQRTITFILPSIITATVPHLCPKGSMSCPMPVHDLTPGTYILSVITHHPMTAAQEMRDQMMNTMDDNVMVMDADDDRFVSNWVSFNVVPTPHVNGGGRRLTAETFTRPLRRGSRGQAVRDLQTIRWQKKHGASENDTRIPRL